MTSYRRPPLTERIYRDEDGTPIPYGNRWEEEGDDREEFRAVSTHPERFAPLQDVARALIAHLKDTYDVDADTMDSNDPANLLMDYAVRLRPKGVHGAQLAFTMNDEGVRVQAGLLHTFTFPPCGCDACDADLESTAEELEQRVLAVAAGNYRETVTGLLRKRISFRIHGEDWSESCEGQDSAYSRRTITEAASALRQLDNGTWQPWRPMSRAAA